MFQDSEGDKTQQAKKNMFLDLGSGNTKQSRFQSLLASPDLNMLKLASPELEKLLIAQSAGVSLNGLATPTPTQFVYPKFVTDEQEAYARGFVEALAQLHGTSPGQPPAAGWLPGTTGAPGTSTQSSEPATSTYSTLMPVSTAPLPSSLPFTNFATSSAASTLAGMANGSMTNSPRRPNHHTYVPSGLTLENNGKPSLPQRLENSNSSNGLSVKTEPSTSAGADHTVPSSNPSISPAPSSRMSDSPPLSPGSTTYGDNDFPMNPDEQEKLKVERKRARNRIAARKCRTRKLERISRLEEKVSDLKSKNNELIQTATSLNEQVMQLKQQIMDHMKTGCSIMLPNIQSLPAVNIPNQSQ